MSDEASSCNELGTRHYSRGEFHKAIESYQASLALARTSSNREVEAIALYNIGDSWHQLGDLAKAESLYRESLALDMPATSYICAYGLACIALARKAQTEAHERLRECERLCKALLAVEPDANKPAFLIALVRLALGETDRGFEACRLALQSHYTPHDASMALFDLVALKQAAPDIKGLDPMERILRTASAGTPGEAVAGSSAPAFEAAAPVSPYQRRADEYNNLPSTCEACGKSVRRGETATVSTCARLFGRTLWERHKLTCQTCTRVLTSQGWKLVRAYLVTAQGLMDDEQRAREREEKRWREYTQEGSPVGRR